MRKVEVEIPEFGDYTLVLVNHSTGQLAARGFTRELIEDAGVDPWALICADLYKSATVNPGIEAAAITEGEQ